MMLYCIKFYKCYSGCYHFWNMYRVNTDFGKINEKILYSFDCEIKTAYQPNDVIV